MFAHRKERKIKSISHGRLRTSKRNLESMLDDRSLVNHLRRLIRKNEPSSHTKQLIAHCCESGGIAGLNAELIVVFSF